jgi:N6-adenosine-specific RNA methylase IME4
MWATFPMLREALAVMQAWGFDYRTGGAWPKRYPSGKLAFGPGYRCRSTVEPWLLGIRGKPKNSRSHRNIIEGAVREHSRKPDSVYEWCSTYVEGPKAELFSSTDWPGFASWGSEAAKFNQQEELIA